MKRILGEVSVREADGCLKKIMELLENKQLGHYYLYQLGQFLHEAPTGMLAQKWLESLSRNFVWEKAEEHFKETKQVWYNELEWPFQICVLEIGGVDQKILRKKWEKKFSNLYPDNKIIKYIDDLDLLSLSKKIKLIRLKPKHLGFSKETPFEKLNCTHPQFNLFPCPPETAFFMRLLIKAYHDSAPTVFAMDFQPSTMVNKTKKRIFSFSTDGYLNDIFMRAWEMTPSNTSKSEDYWIFQYGKE